MQGTLIRCLLPTHEHARPASLQCNQSSTLGRSPLLPLVPLPHTCARHCHRCIPVRFKAGQVGALAVEVLLISSRGQGKGYVFPKVRRSLAAACDIPQPTHLYVMPHIPPPPLTYAHRPCVVQGGWETDETVDVAAMRETVEEAGVRGRLEVRAAPTSGWPPPTGLPYTYICVHHCV